MTISNDKKLWDESEEAFKAQCEAQKALNTVYWEFRSSCDRGQPDRSLITKMTELATETADAAALCKTLRDKIWGETDTVAT